jgi:two-component system phosphate regulon sensor histidine kinase PhoR
MPSRPSLLSRLYWLLGILGVGFLLLAAHLYRDTKRLLFAELHRELVGDLEWASSLTRADPGLLRFPRSDSLARAIAAHKQYRVTIIAPDGTVIGESQVPVEHLDAIANHADRPEVAAARAAGAGAAGWAQRPSATIGQEMYYVAMVPAPGAPIIRVAAGSATLAGFRAAAWRAAVLALLLFAAVAAVIALWVSYRISRPLLRLRGAARDVSKPLRWEAPFREAEILNEAFVDYAGAVQKLAGEVRAERDRLLALLDRLEEGVVLLDAAGRVRAANASAQRLLPLREGAVPLEGRAFRDAVAHEGLGRWVMEARLNAARESVHQVDKGPDSQADLLCHLRLLQPGGAETLLTLVDVTGFRNLDRAKTDFVANASHELKTPLSSILGYAETLLEGAQDNPAARGPFLQKIHANAQRLQGLVQDLLNLSQLESQGAPPRVEPLFVRDFAQAAWNQHRAEAERNGIRFENRVPPGLSWNVEPRDLDLMIGNLIGNAVKYNASGGKVRVEWEPETRVLGVRDTGAGIPAEALPRIFERFYRGGAARARNEGTGLGLAIVKHAAQRYGIAVSAESVVGAGSAFFLEVPEELIGG